MLVDGVFHTEEIVVKPLSSKLRHIPLFSGNTILGDGAVVLIIDPNGVARMVGQTAGRDAAAIEEPAVAGAAEAAETVTLLIFRGGGESLKAVPPSLVTRLEEIDAGRIEWVGGRALIQYRGRLMPLVPADPEVGIRREGPQPLVVFSDGERQMGLAVEEIVDIVDDRLDIELAADRGEVVGSAVIRNRATEILNVAHYLPLAHEDWAKPARGRGANAPTVLLVDDSAFFREILTPVLKAAGYRVAAADSADRALALVSSDARIDVVVTDIDMPGKSGFDLVAALRGDPRSAALPVIALASAPTAEAVERARKLAIAEFVAKFDRSGLVAALAETRVPLGEAA
jgi:two-component system, chemotaxis family, sensor kinase CheA